MLAPKYLNSLPNVKDWGLDFKDKVRFTVINLTFKMDSSGTFKI